MNHYSELRRDLFFGIICIAFSIFLLWGISATIADRPNSTGITARTFPYIINMLLFITGCILTCVTGIKIAKMDNSLKQQYISVMSKEQLTRIAIFVGLLVAYLLGLTTIGFLTSSIIVVAVVHWLLGARNWLLIGIISVSSSLSIWYLFVEIMGVQFPEAFLL